MSVKNLKEIIENSLERSVKPTFHLHNITQEEKDKLEFDLGVEFELLNSMGKSNTYHTNVTDGSIIIHVNKDTEVRKKELLAEIAELEKLEEGRVNNA